MHRVALYLLVLFIAVGLACLPVTADNVGPGAIVQQQSPPVASPTAPVTVDASTAGVIDVAQEIAALKGELQASVEAKLAEFHKTVVNQTDVWLNRSIIGFVAAFVVWWARFQAKQHGYIVQRRKRLAKCEDEKVRK